MNISVTCNIKQNNFQSGVFNFLEQFRREKHFLDVTLECRDGVIQAHRIVLSLYSPCFYDTFKGSVDPQTSVSLKNIPINMMELLLKFMYEGEVNLDISLIHDFLKFGHDLRISGFPSNEDDNVQKYLSTVESFKKTLRDSNSSNMKGTQQIPQKISDGEGSHTKNTSIMFMDESMVEEVNDEVLSSHSGYDGRSDAEDETNVSHLQKSPKFTKIRIDHRNIPVYF